MNPKRWQQIEELFRTVIHRPADEREAHLTRACGGDEELRQEVLSLLARDDTKDFLSQPIANIALTLSAESPDDLTGTRIGVYRLTRLIGRGGMGAVYEAVRDDEQFQQKVALKLIKRGMDSAFVRERFLRERQILASLDHPHIAHLLDGGATPDGQPYFVMEFVAGEPITQYCNQQKLQVNEKLKLFRDVCSAVQHAHQKLIVHRDLKPNNILVTANTTPKLLDFGIAKLLAADPGEAITRTETALRLMTPDYASPEQVRGGSITTATDVYSLGAVLYELLTGRRPHQFETYSPAAIERAICDTESPRPSDAARQQTNAPTKLARQLEGDLDNIVLMALRKEPARRYQSVEQFSEDIRRYLEGLPVLARKDTFAYRASKFARRHKAGVAILILLTTLAIAMTFQTFRISQERDRANQSAITAETMTQSLISLFEFADPGKARGNAITAKELLDQSAERVVRDLKDQPLVQARLMDTLGGLYQRIGVYDRAQTLLESALNLRRQTPNADPLDVAASLNHLAELLKQRGDFANSERLHRESLAIRSKLLPADHLDFATSLNDLGTLLVDRNNLDEAEPMLLRSLEIRRKLLGEEHLEIVKSLTSLGRLNSEKGKFADAAKLYRQSLDLRRKLVGSEHPDMAISLNNLAAMLEELQDYDGAEVLYREALALRRKALGEEHPDYAVSLANLASVLQYKRQFEESEQLYRQVIALRRKLFGDKHPRLAISINNLGILLSEKGDLDGAEPLLRQSLAMRRELLGENHPEVGTSTHNLAQLLYEKNQFEEAEPLFRQALAIYAKSIKPDHWLVHRCRRNLGACLIKLKRFDEAEEHLLAAHSGLQQTHGEQHELTRKAVSRLIELYEVWGKPAQAQPYRALPR